MLGEKVAATIKANYYFGGPVAEAKVKYKITRTPADERWYPAARWDWLFGPGYWWFAADSSWYPGWSRWGMLRPVASWWGRHHAPPEVVAEADRADPARRNAGRRDRYRAGQGGPPRSGPAVRDHGRDHRPVAPHDRGNGDGAGRAQAVPRLYLGRSRPLPRRRHDRGGDRAQTLDHKPVAGKGTLKLLKIAYDAERRPVETPVESWDLALDAEGQAHQAIKASAPGQYRLAATIDDGKGHVIEGGYLLTITGQGFDSASFRFNDLEIIPERKEYRPGETLRLLINTNQVNSTVLALRPADERRVPAAQGRPFARQEHGRGDRHRSPRHAQYLRRGPDRRRRQGARRGARDRHSAGVAGRRYRGRALAERPTSPARRPRSSSSYRTGTPTGSPFVGSTVLAVYDKAVEYISGGSNVPDIKEFLEVEAVASSPDRVEPRPLVS